MIKLKMICLNILRNGGDINELTGPPQKSPLQLAAAGGYLDTIKRRF